LVVQHQLQGTWTPLARYDRTTAYRLDSLTPRCTDRTWSIPGLATNGVTGGGRTAPDDTLQAVTPEWKKKMWLNL